MVENHFLHQDNELRRLFSLTNIPTRHFKRILYRKCKGFSITLPGSQIPDWFNHQCRGSSVTVRLPPKCFFSKFLGIAICAISNNNASLQSASCVCTLKGNHAQQSFSFPLLNRLLKTERLLESDQLFLAYKTCLIGEREDDRIYTEATFRLVVVDNGVSTTDLSATEECCWIKSCGVRLFHINHEEVHTLSPTHPKIHVDSVQKEKNLVDNYNAFVTKREMFDRRSLEVKEIRKRGVGVRRAICCCFPSAECTLRKRIREMEEEDLIGVTRRKSPLVPSEDVERRAKLIKEMKDI